MASRWAPRGFVLIFDSAISIGMRTRWLRGDGVELAEYCTLVNAQRRVLADIGLERQARDVNVLASRLPGSCRYA